MNFQTMDYFVMTAEKQSFTRAAEELHITQQTLSSHIANLEDELGSRLFVRHVPLELTYAGEVFLKYAQDFQQKYWLMKREFSDISGKQQGELKIGIAPTRSRVLLPKLIGGFEKRYPKISVKFFGNTNADILQDLQDGVTDVAIARFPEQLPGIVTREFYRENVVLLVSKRLLSEVYGEAAKETALRAFREQSLKPLQACPFLLNNRTDLAGEIGRNLIRRANFHPQLKARSDDIEMLLKLCVEGVGACFTPEYLARGVLTAAELDDLYLLRFHEEAQYPISFGWKEQSYQWSLIRQFMESVMESGNELPVS